MKSLMDAKEQRGDGKTSSRGGTDNKTETEHVEMATLDVRGSGRRGNGAGLHLPERLGSSVYLALQRACTCSEGSRRSSLYIPALLHRNPFKDHLRQDTSLINSAHCTPSSEVGSFHATLLGAG